LARGNAGLWIDHPLPSTPLYARLEARGRLTAAPNTGGIFNPLRWRHTPLDNEHRGTNAEA